jgi:Tol biopolymer transport system component
MGPGVSCFRSLPSVLDADPQWSADGRWLAFTRYEGSPSSPRPSVFVMGADGSNPIRIRRDGVGEAAVWAPPLRRS